MPPSTAQSLHGEISSRLHDQHRDGDLEVTYSVPKAGSRARKDGVKVEWESSRPTTPSSGTTPHGSSSLLDRTDLPFFCHDVTSRNTRVPFDDVQKTTHPCGAVGIKAVQVLVPQANFAAYAKLYEIVLGTPARSFSGEGCRSDEKGVQF